MATIPTTTARAYQGSVVVARGPITLFVPCDCTRCLKDEEIHHLMHGAACACAAVSRWQVETIAESGRMRLSHVRTASIAWS